MKLQSLIPLLALGAAVSCSDSTAPSGSIDLLLAKQRWQSHNYHDYRFTLQMTCFCANTNPLRIAVIHDTVFAATDLKTGGSALPHAGMRVNDLFEVVRNAQRAGTPLEVTYDAELGFPTKIIDNGPAMTFDGGATYYASDVSAGVFVVQNVKN
ncbi:MAG TPA: DUF6174 domain-containing protein [Gemmatimonadaceae bacterium]|jgi:hypothetical protein